MNLINIIQSEHRNHQMSKQKRKLSKQSKKTIQNYQILLNSTTFTDFLISNKVQQISNPINNGLKNIPVYISTASQTNYQEQIDQIIPESEMQKVKQLSEIIAKLETAKHKHDDIATLSENASEEIFYARQFEISRLEQELGLLPQINQQAKLQEQDEELQELQLQYKELCEQHIKLQNNQEQLRKKISNQINFS